MRGLVDGRFGNVVEMLESRTATLADGGVVLCVPDGEVPPGTRLL